MALAIPIAMMAFSAISNSMQAREANKQAGREMAIAAGNDQRTQVELDRQQGEVNEASRQQKSDRIRMAEEELGFIRVASAEGGALGISATLEAGYLEGLDLSRIEQNRKSDLSGIQAKKVNSAMGAQVSIDDAGSKAKAASRAAVMNTIGSGLQIAGNYQSQKRIEAAAKNTRQ